MEWLTDNKLPVGKAAKSVFDWLKDNAEPLFDAMSTAMKWLIEAISRRD